MVHHTSCSVAERIGDVCRYIECHSDGRLTLDELAARAAMSRFHFARSFKSVVGVTPKQYVDAMRLRRLKGDLKDAKPIDAAVYDAGYASPSRVYEQADGRLGMTPAQYRSGAAGVTISYATLATPLGTMMMGATDRGVCFVAFGEREASLLEQLRAEYRNAILEPMRDPFAPQFRAWADAILAHLSGDQPHLDLPLDVRATAFQLRVWNYLRSIPYGDVASYTEVAHAIGAPSAVRAVANACARNVVAVAIPCHRVIRGTGELGGYRWGLPRKRALLDRERSAAAAARP
jgi:AraC family transcriptional regulator of adaptative response/methylated-DNA-[protein]-cysteine methyltransferase